MREVTGTNPLQVHSAGWHPLPERVPAPEPDDRKRDDRRVPEPLAANSLDMRTGHPAAKSHAASSIVQSFDTPAHHR